MMVIMSFFCVPLTNITFVETFYELKLTSIYEYLEWRFHSVIVRCVASFTFILQMFFMNAVAMFAPAIAMEAIVGIPVWLSITGIGIVGTIYTSFGGIKAVVWTDCFQFVMIAIGMVAIVTRGIWTAGGVAETFRIANEGERLVLLDFTFDPFMRHNFWNFVIGYGFAIVALYGTHQPLVQRYCSLPTVRDAKKALLVTTPFLVFTYTLVLLTGIFLFATYSGCCPILLGKIGSVDQIVPHFVINELAFIPGLMGVFVSCVFSAVLSTMNSLAAVTWEDFLSKLSWFKTRPGDNTQAFVLKIVSVIYGILSIFMAISVQYMGQMFQVTMTAIGATAGTLVGVFTCALFLPCINKSGSVAGTTVSLVSMMYLAIQAFLLQLKQQTTGLISHTDLDSCPIDTDFTNARNLTASHTGEPEIEWPNKLYTISYLLYPCIGSLICIIVALIVSLFTGGISGAKKVPRKYLHPWVQHFSDNVEDDIGKSPVSNNNNPYPYKYDEVTGSTVPVLITDNEKSLV